jgi:hypothetical protein
MWDRVVGWWNAAREFFGFGDERGEAPEPGGASPAPVKAVKPDKVAMPERSNYDPALGYRPQARTFASTAKGQAAAPGKESSAAASAAKPDKAAMPEMPSVEKAAAPAPRPAAPTPKIAGAGLALQAQISIPVTINGVPSKDMGEALVGAIKAQESQLTSYFEKLLARIASNQRRLAYDQ